MIIAIHQPNYLPYLGFFDKMKKADVFVIYDDAQFNKEDFQHRNKIRIYHGWKWLTVPVEKKLIPINEIKIKNEIMTKKIKWSDAHFENIRENYKHADHFIAYEKDLKEIFNGECDKLIDLNMKIINFLMEAFNIRKKLVFSSEFGFTSKSSERLVEMVEALGGDIYLSGPMGRSYLDISMFEKKGIKVEFQDFTHPIYKQIYEGFLPNMSVIDALFNLGEMPKNIGEI
jgi:hypothetical protein